MPGTDDFRARLRHSCRQIRGLSVPRARLDEMKIDFRSGYDVDVDNLPKENE